MVGRLSFLATVTLVLASALSAFAQLEGGDQQPENKNLPHGPMAPTHRAFFKTIEADQLRVADEYAARTKDPEELRTAGRKLVLAARRVSMQLPAEMTQAGVVAEALRLMNAGSKDPLIVAIAMEGQPFIVNPQKMFDNCKQAVEDVKEQYGFHEQIDVIRRCDNVRLNIYNKTRTQRKKYPSQPFSVINDCFARWLASEADSKEEQRKIWAFIRETYLPHPTNSSHRQLVEVARQTREMKVHPWARHMLDAYEGMYEANERIAKRLEGREKFFADAAKGFTAAWEAAPEFPEPAIRLILLARDGYAEDSPRQWFERAVRAELDHPMIYTTYRTYLRSQGADELLRFGRHCAATKRYDTKVPFELLECGWAVENAYGTNGWAKQGVYDDVKQMLEGARQAPTFMGMPNDQKNKEWLTAIQIVVGARADRLDDIPQLWEKTNQGALAQAARGYGLRMPLPELKMAATAARNDPTRLVGAAEKAVKAARDAESIAAAVKAVKTAEDYLKPDDPRLETWKSIVRLKHHFFAGRPAKVVFPADYIQATGVRMWKRIDQHTLQAEGSSEMPLPMLATLEPPYELAFQVEAENLPKNCYAGIQLGRLRPPPNLAGFGRYFGVNPKTKEVVMRDYALLHLTPPSFKEVNDVRIRAFVGHYEFYVNGLRVKANPAGNFNPAGHATLVVPSGLFDGPVVRFKNFHIRQLSYGPPHRHMTPEMEIHYFTARIADEPDHIYHYLDRGEAYREANLPKKAAADFKRLIDAHEHWPQALVLLGTAEAASGNYEQAIKHYRRAIELQPNYALAYARLAWLEATATDEKFRNGDQAVAHAKQALAINKHWDLLKFPLAAAYAEQGNFKAATDALNRTGKLPFHPEKAHIQPLREAIDAKRGYQDNGFPVLEE